MSPARRPTAAELMTGKATPGISTPRAKAASVSETPVRKMPPGGENLTPGSDRKPTLAKPVRVTLNIPPELYRQLRRWMESAAPAIGAPHVNVQDTLRAMIDAATRDEVVTGRVLGLLRRETK